MSFSPIAAEWRAAGVALAAALPGALAAVLSAAAARAGA